MAFRAGERLHVYALVAPSALSPGVTGLRRERLQRIAFRGVHAIVGPVPRAAAATPAALVRYDAIIHKLARRYPALLPSRFGTILDVAELAAIVDLRRDALARALRLVRNRVQMTLRVFSP